MPGNHIEPALSVWVRVPGRTEEKIQITLLQLQSKSKSFTERFRVRLTLWDDHSGGENGVSTSNARRELQKDIPSILDLINHLISQFIASHCQCKEW